MKQRRYTTHQLAVVTDGLSDAEFADLAMSVKALADQASHGDFEIYAHPLRGLPKGWRRFPHVTIRIAGLK